MVPLFNVVVTTFDKCVKSVSAQLRCVQTMENAGTKIVDGFFDIAGIAVASLPLDSFTDIYNMNNIDPSIELN